MSLVLEPGARVLEEWVLERPLGEGGYAEVWLARRAVGQPVAIKFQKKDVLPMVALRAFTRESSRVASLRHPNIVTILGAGVVDGRAYTIMEYLDGSTLEEVVSEAREGQRGLPLSSVLRWSRELSSALDALHAEGLVHRDLKPPNIMICAPDRRAKVLDLGLAHDAHVVADDLTTLGRVKGTTAYMSPEQAMGERVGPPSDVFALTTIVFELLTGLRPWLRNTNGGFLLAGERVPTLVNDRYTVLERIVHGVRPRPSVLVRDMPAVLDHVFAAGWSLDPAERPSPTRVWVSRLEAAFASAAPMSSVWLMPERGSGLADARAPLLAPRSATPALFDHPTVHVTEVAPPRGRPSSDGPSPDETSAALYDETPGDATRPPRALGQTLLLAPADQTLLAEPRDRPSLERADTQALGSQPPPSTGRPSWPWVAGALLLLAAGVWGVSEALLALEGPRAGALRPPAPDAASASVAPTSALPDPSMRPVGAVSGAASGVTSAATSSASDGDAGSASVGGGGALGRVATSPTVEAAPPRGGTRASPSPVARGGTSAAPSVRATPSARATPRASARPSPSAIEPGPDPALARLRARLEADPAGALDDVGAAVRARARALEPERRRAVERWVDSAVELRDPRPLVLAIDALMTRP
jgi:serine/threonine protein kinase